MRILFLLILPMMGISQEIRFKYGPDSITQEVSILGDWGEDPLAKVLDRLDEGLRFRSLSDRGEFWIHIYRAAIDGYYGGSYSLRSQKLQADVNRRLSAMGYRDPPGKID